MYGWLKKDERRWFIVVGVIVVLEAFNLGLMMGAYLTISLIVTVLFIVFASYVLLLFYQFVKEKQKNVIDNHHTELVERLENVTQALGNTKEALSKQSQEQYEVLTDKLQAVDEKVNNQVLQLSETLSKKLATTEKNLEKLHNDNKEELLTDIRANFRTLTNKVDTYNETVTKQMDDAYKQIIEEISNRSDTLVAKLDENEAATVEKINSEAKQMSESINDHQDTLMDRLAQQHEAVTKQVKHLNASLLEEMRMRNENLVEMIDQKEATLNAVIKEETTQTNTLLNETREQVGNTLDNILAQNNNTRDQVVDQAMTNYNKMIDRLTEQHATATNLITSGKNSVLEGLKSTSDNLTESLAQNETAIAGFIKTEGTQTASRFDMVSDHIEQVSREIKEQSTKITDEISAKVNDDSLAVVSSIKEHLVQDTVEWKNQLDLYTNQSTVQIETVSELIQEKAQESSGLLAESVGHTEQYVHDQLRQLSETVSEEQTTIHQDSLAKWDAIANETLEKQLERFNQTNAFLQNGFDVIREKTDQNATITASRLSDKIVDTQEQISAKIASTSNNSEQVLGDVKQELLENVGLLSQEQSELKAVINQAIIEETERQERAISQINALNESMTVLQNDAMQRVQEQFSIFRGDQQSAVKANQENVAKRFVAVNQHLNNVANEISSLINNLTVWKADQTEYNATHEMLTNINEKFSSSEQVVSQQEAIEYKVDVLGTQLQHIQALINIVQTSSNERNENTRVEETNKSGNRTEKIADDKNDIVIVNQFKDDVLTHSDMYQSGKKVYTAVYDKKGSMTSSENFDSDENVLTKMTYFPDGSVKQRKERVKINGKKEVLVTKFDQNGKKLN